MIEILIANPPKSKSKWSAPRSKKRKAKKKTRKTRKANPKPAAKSKVKKGGKKKMARKVKKRGRKRRRNAWKGQPRRHSKAAKLGWKRKKRKKTTRRRKRNPGTARKRTYKRRRKTNKRKSYRRRKYNAAPRKRSYKRRRKTNRRKYAVSRRRRNPGMLARLPIVGDIFAGQNLKMFAFGGIGAVGGTIIGDTVQKYVAPTTPVLRPVFTLLGGGIGKFIFGIFKQKAIGNYFMIGAGIAAIADLLYTHVIPKILPTGTVAGYGDYIQEPVYNGYGDFIQVPQYSDQAMVEAGMLGDQAQVEAGNLGQYPEEYFLEHRTF